MGALLTAVVSFFVRQVVIKFVIFTALYVVVSAFIAYVVNKLPDFASPGTMLSMLNAWTPAMWYFADLTLWGTFFPMLISACIFRFAIRRIPLIG